MAQVEPVVVLTKADLHPEPEALAERLTVELRGVDVVHVPTTLLGMVDAAVGGKTGIDFGKRKNLIGPFSTPRLVLMDVGFLDSLPDTEFASGMAEVIKYGLIRDAGFFDWLETHIDRLMALDESALSEAIYRSCQNKA